LIGEKENTMSEGMFILEAVLGQYKSVLEYKKQFDILDIDLSGCGAVFWDKIRCGAPARTISLASYRVSEVFQDTASSQSLENIAKRLGTTSCEIAFAACLDLAERLKKASQKQVEKWVGHHRFTTAPSVPTTYYEGIISVTVESDRTVSMGARNANPSGLWKPTERFIACVS
jgi:hypothetical protein